MSLWQGFGLSGPGTRSAVEFGRVGRLAAAILLVTLSAVGIGLATGRIITSTGLTSSADPAAPLAPVIDAATTWRGSADDPAITLPSGVQVKSSNYEGVRVGDTTYYYNLAPHPSYDPLARGDVSTRQVHVVAVVGDLPNRVLIYTVDRTRLAQSQ